MSFESPLYLTNHRDNNLLSHNLNISKSFAAYRHGECWQMSLYKSVRYWKPNNKVNSFCFQINTTSSLKESIMVTRTGSLNGTMHSSMEPHKVVSKYAVVKSLFNFSQQMECSPIWIENYKHHHKTVSLSIYIYIKNLFWFIKMLY